MARITKIELVQTNARLAAENNELRHLVSQLRAPQRSTQQRSTQQSLTQSLAQFCSAYCATHGVRSVPGHVVQAWRAQQ